ncbi:MAG: hypothetical protein JNM62_07375 [Flavobacteriales bacterium]|nr:hypothetical protein [Flavobacteriales bacterium]
MTRLRTLIFLLALASCMATRAQDITAQAYFDRASKEYVKQDKMLALRTLDEALQKYPGDPKLLKLAEELVKEEEKKQQDQQQKDQQQKEQEKKDQDKQQQDQQQEQQQQEQQQKEQQQQEQERAKQDQQKERQGQPQPNSIAPQDAMRMLDALERSEKDVQEKVRARRRPAVRRNIEKDW